MAMFYLHRSPFKPLIKKKNNPFINKQSNQIAVLFRSVKRPSHFDFSSQTGSHQQQTSQSGTFFLIAIDWHLLLVKRKTEIWKQQNFTIPYIYVCVCVFYTFSTQNKHLQVSFLKMQQMCKCASSFKIIWQRLWIGPVLCIIFMKV